MRNRLFGYATVVLIISVKNVFGTASFKKEESCFPLSGISYVAGTKSMSGINKFDFEQMIEKTQTLMGPEVQQRLGKKLIIEKRWEDGTVDAYATRDDDNNAVIVVNGGLARHPSMTKDAFLLLICHELGHHLGGAPRIPRTKSALRGWSSAEGQADYYATSKCLPIFYKAGMDIKNGEGEDSASDYSLALSKCHDEICVRITLAGLSASRVFASLVEGTPKPQLTSMDPTKVPTTFYRHPNPQCRLDTYLAGANCDVGQDIPFDSINPKIGACASEKNARPSCWFQEKDF